LAPPVRRARNWTWARSGGWSKDCWRGGKVQLVWNVPKLYWAKDWAKLLMNATLLAADCLPRGGTVTVEAGSDPLSPSFHIRAEGLNARVTEEVSQAIKGEAANVDARHVQPFLTYKLSQTVGTTFRSCRLKARSN
jgi:histidine phosphotransferase ChpT